MLAKFTLSNGIHVVTYRIPSLKSFHLRLCVKGGSLVESDEKNGIAHYMEHMLVQGIPSFPTAEMLSAYIERLAGNYGASTSQNLVSFSMVVPTSHKEDAIKIGSEVFFKPLFPQEAMEKERRAVINEIQQDMDSRWYKFQEFFKKTRYTPESILQRRIGGTIDTVESLTRQDLITYWETYFIPTNTYLFILGDFEQSELGTLLANYFSTDTSNKSFTGYPLFSDTDLSKRTIAIRSDKSLQVNYLELLFGRISKDEPLRERMKQAVALITLGQLRSSRLFTLLRYQKGLVYGVGASDIRYPGVGYAHITSEVASEHLDEVLSLIVAVLLKFIQEGITTEELSITKNYLSNSAQMAFDNPSSIANWIQDDFLWEDTILLPDEYIAILQSITKQEIDEHIQLRWTHEKLNLIIQGPLDDTEEQKEKMKKIISDLI